MLETSTLTVVVRNKDKILYNGQARGITATNDKGPFDILQQHENFISLIRGKIIIHVTPKEEKEIQIENGIVRVYRDKVYIYVNFQS